MLRFSASTLPRVHVVEERDECRLFLIESMAVLRAASCELPSRDEDQMRSVTRGVHTADEWAHSLRRLWFRQREVALTG